MPSLCPREGPTGTGLLCSLEQVLSLCLQASVCPAAKWGHNAHLSKIMCVRVCAGCSPVAPKTHSVPWKLLLQVAPQAPLLSALAGFGRGEATADGERGQGISPCAVVWPQLLSKDPSPVLTLLGSGNTCASPCTFRLDSGAKPASVGSLDATHSSANSPFLKLSSVTPSPSWRLRVHKADCLAQS